MNRNNNLYDYYLIAKEILKNIVMGIPGFKFIRTKIGSGRTTGHFDLEDAIKYAKETVQLYLSVLGEAGYENSFFYDKIVLEVGTGANLLVPIMLLEKGAKHVTTIDRFKDLRPSISNSYIKMMVSNSKNECEFINYNSLEKRIIYKGNCSIEFAANILSRKFDVVVSHLTMEHTKNLEKAIKNISELLKKNGVVVIICNLKSLGGVPHYKSSPLSLLTYSPFLWRLMFGNRGGSNRYRIDYYKKCFLQYNISIKHISVLESLSLDYIREMRPFLNSRFKNLDDETLSITKFALVGVKR